MKISRLSGLVLIILSALILVHCTQVDHLSKDHPLEERPPLQGTDVLSEKISRMSQDEKIGQLVIVGLEGYSLKEDALKMIEDYQIGGFIFFQRNLKNPSQISTLINALKKSNDVNDIPLFLALDQEGGRVHRMPPEIRKLPSSREIGQVGSEDFSYGVGNLLGDQLGQFGFNMNFAPVLDLDSNPDNPVIGDRSFSANAAQVSQLGVQTMKGIQGHVASIVKHFPGHGDTLTDSHLDLPVLPHSLGRLMDLELIPFQEAIDHGADGVMVAHILLPSIDPDNPSSLSKTIITDVLREEMGFEGVIITDDITMGAITENYDVGQAAVQAILAGVDIVLVCHHHQAQVEVMEALKRAVANDIITEAKLEEHVYRILELKHRYKIDDEPSAPAKVSEINKKIYELIEEYAPDLLKF